ncbi:MAG: hypothetical protein MUP81_01705 [Dehalococcoidia bacterium]|nr:hypothetical protein [Dehalococcoidia bacterium]
MKQEQRQEHHSIIEVIEFCRANSLPADVVGHWVWVSFEQKPSDEIRQAMKDFGFRWSSRRGEWAHNCGYPTKSGHCIPRVKYGAVPISKVELADVA